MLERYLKPGGRAMYYALTEHIHSVIVMIQQLILKFEKEWPVFLGSLLFIISSYLICRIKLIVIIEGIRYGYSGIAYIEYKTKVFITNSIMILKRMIIWIIVSSFFISISSGINATMILLLYSASFSSAKDYLYKNFNSVSFWKSYFYALLICILMETIITIISFGETWSFERTSDMKSARKRRFVSNIKIFGISLLCGCILFGLGLLEFQLGNVSGWWILVALLIWSILELELLFLGCAYKDYDFFSSITLQFRIKTFFRTIFGVNDR